MMDTGTPVKEVYALAKALAECQSLEKRDGRDDFVGFLPTEIKDQIARRDETLGDLVCIIKECIRHPDGLDYFLEVFSEREQNPDDKSRVMEYAERLKEKLPLKKKLALDVVTPSVPVPGESIPAPEQGGESAAPTGRGYALVIGISDHLYHPKPGKKIGRKEFYNLDFAAKDARDLAVVLRKETHIDYHVSCLDDRRADRRGIMHELDELRKQCQQSGEDNPLVLIFFSGHAVSDGERHFLIPHDADCSDLFATALWSKTFDSALSELKTNRLVVFLDTCHAGAFGPEGVKDGGVAPGDPRNFVGERYFIAASAAGQQSRELEGNGIFTGHLLRLLRCEDTEVAEREEVELAELYEILKRKVSETAEKHGLGKQIPEANLPAKTDIVLAINQAAVERRKERERGLFEAVCVCEVLAGPRETIKMRLREFVENRVRAPKLEEAGFYRLFTERLEWWKPDDVSGTRELCSDLVNAFNAAVGRTGPDKRDQFTRGADAQKAISAKVGVTAPYSSTQNVGAEMKLTLSEEQRNSILESISSPEYAVEANELEELLSKPGGVSSAELTNWLRKTKPPDADTGAWKDVVRDIGKRFMAFMPKTVMGLRMGQSDV